MINVKTMFMGMLMAMTPLYMYATDIKGHFMSSTSTVSPFQIVIESSDTLNQWKVESTFYEPYFNISTENKGCCAFKIMQQGKVVYVDSLVISRHDHKPWRHKANEDSGDSGSGGKSEENKYTSRWQRLYNK